MVGKNKACHFWPGLVHHVSGWTSSLQPPLLVIAHFSHLAHTLCRFQFYQCKYNCITTQWDMPMGQPTSAHRDSGRYARWPVQPCSQSSYFCQTLNLSTCLVRLQSPCMLFISSSPTVSGPWGTICTLTADKSG